MEPVNVCVFFLRSKNDQTRCLFSVSPISPKLASKGTVSPLTFHLPSPEEPLNYAVKVAFHRGDVHELPHWYLVLV